MTDETESPDEGRIKLKLQGNGYIEPEIQEEDYILGDGMLQGEVLQPDGQWLDYLPDPELQKRRGVETSNCVGFNTLENVEILLKRKYGGVHNYSERALGIMAGTYPPGNDPHKVAETIRKQGLVPEYELPFTENILTVDEYYNPKPLPESLIQRGKEWLFWYDFKHEYVFDKGASLDEKHRSIIEALKYSPLGVSVFAWAQDANGVYQKLGRDNHWTCLVGYKLGAYWLVRDSYEPHLKTLEWNYDFGIAKRYAITKHGSTPKKNYWWSRVYRRLGGLFTK